MKETKNDKAIMECYVELYKNSTPPADFNELMGTAEINEHGQKVIDFMAYEIDEKLYDEIVDGIIKKYKFVNYKKQQFKTTVALGCSPKFKKDA
jgi:hypothetical protein